jgi:sugar transferase (PEP-CTERM/EpsH1 system associated)
MNILIAVGDVPATSGMPGSPRLWNLCRQLATRHRLFLAVRGESEERWRSFRRDPEVSRVFADVVRLPEEPRPSWWGRQHHRLRAACYLSSQYRNPAYHRRLRRLLSEDMVAGTRADLVYVDGLSMTQYFDRRAGLPMIADVHDCFSLLFSRSARRERRRLRRLAIALEARSIARMERSLAVRYGVVITNSSVDEGALRRLMPNGRVVTIPNGVDCEYWTPGSNGHHSRRVVFTGVMDYGPNVDAAQYCADEIFPLVRASVPDAELWLVGADPSPAVRELARREGVHVTGKVDDVRPYVRAASVCVCPIRFGAGIKNKILSALAMAKPVVTTSIGLEGIDARPDRHVLRADTPGEFADAVTRVLGDERLARQLGDNGCRLVTERYSWPAQAEAFEREIAATARRA